MSADEQFVVDIGGAVLRAVEQLEAAPALTGSVFTVAHPTAGLVTVRVSLRGAGLPGGPAVLVEEGTTGDLSSRVFYREGQQP